MTESEYRQSIEEQSTIVDEYLSFIDKNPVNETVASRIIGQPKVSVLRNWRKNGLINPFKNDIARKVQYDSNLIKRAFVIDILVNEGLKIHEIRQALTGITRVNVEIEKNYDKFTELLKSFFVSLKSFSE